MPIWMAYMGKALAGVPETPVRVPEGVIEVGGDFYYAETRPGQGIASVGMGDDRHGSGTKESGDASTAPSR